MESKDNSQWTPEEIDRLRELSSEGVPVAKVMKTLTSEGFPERTSEAISQKKYEMRFIFARPRFSEKEVLLLDYLFSFGIAMWKIQEIMVNKGFPPSRSLTSLRQKLALCKSVRLRGVTHGQTWTTSEFTEAVTLHKAGLVISRIAALLAENGHPLRSVREIAEKFVKENYWEKEIDEKFWRIA